MPYAIEKSVRKNSRFENISDHTKDSLRSKKTWPKMKIQSISSVDSLGSKESLVDRMTIHLKKKYEKLYSDSENVHIPVNIYNKNTGKKIREDFNSMPKLSYIYDQVDNIHYIYFSAHEKIKSHKDKNYLANLDQYKDDLNRLMPYNPDNPLYSKKDYDVEFKRQLEVKRSQDIKVDANEVLDKLFDNEQKPIFIEKNETLALTYLRYRHTNSEIADNLHNYIKQNGLKIEDL